MEGSNLVRSNHRLRMMRLAITMGLAMLFFALLLCGVRQATSAHAIPGTFYVDGASGRDTTDCTNPQGPCSTIGYALSRARDGDTILVAQGTYTENLVITIDAGANDGAPETDLEGDPRPLDGDLYGPTVADMGIDEFHMGMNPFQTVLAAYQAWHGLPSHAPAPYTSTDPIVISDHITEALAQGIDGFVVDWYGPPDGWLNDPDRRFIDQATAELLRQAEGRRFYVAIMYDEGTLAASGVPTTAYQTRAISDLLYARQYFTMPAYLLVHRRPAVFVFAYDHVEPYLDWAEIRSQSGISVTLFDRDPNPNALEHDAQFDSFFAWVQPAASQWSPFCTEWGEGYLTWFYNTMNTAPYTDSVTVGGVWPGFDDSLASWGSGRCMSRRCGQTWRDTWEIADQYHPPIVMIDTWNDFEEGTDVEYGTVGDCTCYLPVVMRLDCATCSAAALKRFLAPPIR